MWNLVDEKQEGEWLVSEIAPTIVSTTRFLAKDGFRTGHPEPERPLQGHGSGSFERSYKAHHLASGAQNATSASHTIPVTVAAEQGLLGLALYAALLVAAFTVLFSGAGRSPPRVAIAACFAALVLHTWTYADFLEDPLTWTLLGIGAALARARGGERCLATSSGS